MDLAEKLLGKSQEAFNEGNLPPKSNRYYFNLFIKFYNMKSNPKYCYEYNRSKAHYFSYSNAALEMIYSEIKKDPEHIVQNLKRSINKKKPTPGAKEF